MVKSTIFVLFALCSTIIAFPLTGPNAFKLGNIEHTYAIGFEIGQMDSQVGPFHLSVAILKQLGEMFSYVLDTKHGLNESTIFTGFSFENYTVKTFMPFSEVDAISFDWEDKVRVFRNIDDVNIQTAYLTEIAPNHSNITKKYCNTEIYPTKDEDQKNREKCLKIEFPQSSVLDVRFYANSKN
ncbi:uncharacterized protein LOC107370498 [Tetranychus urticae]|uniref:uncharacterized protein LOC107370498 n=1 Tax=Tetranychus urticae TaxID=32264 RepID=UPI00077BE39C|nr:uncharacterized protein LOC107370498 [Tetranychus urticae]